MFLWVIDDLARFRCAILWMGHNWQMVGSQEYVDPISPNLERTYGDHSCTRILFQRLDILLHFQMRATQSWVTLKTTPNFVLFDPLWKLGRIGEISIPIMLNLYLRLNLRNTFDGSPQHGCWARWIDKKRKESSWVKLKAFLTNAGWPYNNGAITITKKTEKFCSKHSIIRLKMTGHCTRHNWLDNISNTSPKSETKSRNARTHQPVDKI